jgi:hypothetical protein
VRWGIAHPWTSVTGRTSASATKTKLFGNFLFIKTSGHTDPAAAILPAMGKEGLIEEKGGWLTAESTRESTCRETDDGVEAPRGRPSGDTRPGPP